MTPLTRDDALIIVTSHVTNPNLIKHMLAVEAAMRRYARHFNEDEHLWGVTGLLHDFDWEIHPNLEDHPAKGALILKSQDIDPIIIDAILSHSDHTGVPRDTLLKKTLYASDELTGLITSTTLVKPSKNLADVTLDSVKNKWKNKAFAKNIDRLDIEKAAADLGIPIWDHVQNVLEAMQSISDELGL